MKLLTNIDNSCWLDCILSIFINCNVNYKNLTGRNGYVDQFIKVLNTESVTEKVKLLNKLRTYDLEDFSEMLTKLFDLDINMSLINHGILIHNIDNQVAIFTSTESTALRKIINKVKQFQNFQNNICAFIVYKNIHYYTFYKSSNGEYIHHENPNITKSLTDVLVLDGLYGCVFKIK